jgi:hypothetical protein
MAITATTSRMCIIPPTLKTKAPRIHPIMRITANTYNKSLMMIKFVTGCEIQNLMPTEWGKTTYSLNVLKRKKSKATGEFIAC